MNTKQTLWECAGIERDTVARRRSNTSNVTANINAEQIESGVSLETLLSLNVPVYRYGTQITIHGILPEVSGGYSAGYKALVKNGNGTVGVRYIGIDGEKKHTLCEVSRLFKSTLRAYMNSQGLVCQASFDTGDEAVSFAKTIDSDLFYGTVCAFRSVSLWGSVRYVVEVGIDAVPVANVWAVANNLFGCSSQSEYEALVTQRAIQAAESNAETDRQIAERLAAKNEQERRVSEFAGTVKNSRVTTLPKSPGEFRVVRILKNETEPRLDAVTFRYIAGTRALEYSFGTTFKPLKDYRSYWQTKVSSGLLFTSN